MVAVDAVVAVVAETLQEAHIELFTFRANPTLSDPAILLAWQWQQCSQQTHHNDSFCCSRQSDRSGRSGRSGRSARSARSACSATKEE